MIVALALAMSGASDRRAAMERCAEAVIAARHPNMGMLDVTGTTFEWLSVATAGDDWMIIGSIIEPEGKGRTARRFTCRTHGESPPRIAFGKAVRL